LSDGPNLTTQNEWLFKCRPILSFCISADGLPAIRLLIALSTGSLHFRPPQNYGVSRSSTQAPILYLCCVAAATQRVPHRFSKLRAPPLTAPPPSSSPTHVCLPYTDETFGESGVLVCMTLMRILWMVYVNKRESATRQGVKGEQERNEGKGVTLKRKGRFKR
jgi:hypothetical protein